MVIAVGLAILLVALWGLKNPFAGLLGLVMINSVQPGEIYPVLDSLHVERIVVILVVLSALLHHEKLVFPKVTRSMLILWGVMIVGIPVAYWKGHTLEACISFGQIVFYHLLVVMLVVTESQFKTFIKTYVIGIGWLAVSSTYLYFTGGAWHDQGINRAVALTSAGDNSNTLGLTLVSALPVAALLLVPDLSKRVRILGLLVVLCCMLTIVNTGSRMSFFTLLILLALAFFKKKKNLIFLPVVIVAAVMIWSVVPQELKQRYESVQSLEKDESYQNRVLAWEAGWGMFKDSPLYGMGAGNYAVAAGEKYWPGKKRKIQLNAHSLYFQVMGELALMGIVAFTLFLVTLFKTNFALKRKLLDLPLSKMLCYFPTACNFALVVLLIAGYSSHTLYRTTWYILAAMTAALEGIVNRKMAETPDALPPVESYSAVTA